MIKCKPSRRIINRLWPLLENSIRILVIICSFGKLLIYGEITDSKVRCR